MGWASRSLVVIAVAGLASCAGSRGLAPGQSTLADVEAAMGAPAERRQAGSETWLYYPSQPFGRKVFVARMGPDGRLIGVEQRLTEANIAKLVPSHSRREEVLALFGQPYERLDFPRLQREAWSWEIRHFGGQAADLHVQMSPDGVVREVYIIDENDRGKEPRSR